MDAKVLSDVLQYFNFELFMLSGKTANNGLSMNCRNKLVNKVGKVCTASYHFKNFVLSLKRILVMCLF